MDRRLAAILSLDMAGWTRLMERNEDRVLVRHKAHRRRAIDPAIAAEGGHVVKATGDGVLAGFPSARGAVAAALALQRAALEAETGTSADDRILYRVGINLGDVIFDEGDVFGDGVNVAARMQALAEPGGVCLSDVVHQIAGDRVDVRFRDMGRQRVKGVSRPVRAWQWTPEAPPEAPEPAAAPDQRIRFVESRGARLAWTAIGEGPPVLKAPNWMNHLDYEWRSPIWGPVLAALAQDHRLVRFDQRGGGLSDWEVDEISVDAMEADLRAVADAAGLGRYALLGVSQGCAFSIRHAVENPDRVTVWFFSAATSAAG